MYELDVRINPVFQEDGRKLYEVTDRLGFTEDINYVMQYTKRYTRYVEKEHIAEQYLRWLNSDLNEARLSSVKEHYILTK